MSCSVHETKNCNPLKHHTLQQRWVPCRYTALAGPACDYCNDLLHLLWLCVWPRSPTHHCVYMCVHCMCIDQWYRLFYSENLKSWKICSLHCFSKQWETQKANGIHRQSQWVSGEKKEREKSVSQRKKRRKCDEEESRGCVCPSSAGKAYFCVCVCICVGCVSKHRGT